MQARHLLIKYLTSLSPVKRICLPFCFLLFYSIFSASANEGLDDSSPTSFTTLALARYGEGVHAIAARHGMETEEVLRLNPGLKPWGLHQGDAVVVKTGLLALPELDHARQIRRGPRGRKQIALTFDGAWTTREQVEKLLSVLQKHDAAASFFVTGIFLEKTPEGLELLRRRPYPVYNHTAKHPHLTQCDNARIRRELLEVEEAVASATSGTLSTRPYWRPPFGESDSRVRQVAADAGFQAVYWTVDSLDWSKEPPATVDTIFHRVCERPFEKAEENDPDPLDGAIVLFHVDGKATVGALEKIIPWLREKDYQLVNLETLLDPGASRDY